MISEEFRLAAKDWVEKDAAARLLEESKSAFLSQKMNAYGGISVNKAELLVKASSDWSEYIQNMVSAKTEANLAKVKCEWLRMRHAERQSEEATARAERRI